jgi:peptide/nickel transport system substrate-binding protein
MDWGPNYSAEKPVRGGVLRVASPVYVGLMNPNHFPVLDWVTMSYMYEKLILLDSSYRPTIPWLAESWEFIDDVTVVMRLRKGVRFHDGTTFNAASLKYQMDWIMDKDNAAWTRAWIEPLKSVEALDEYTVRWRFKRPWGPFSGTMRRSRYMISARASKADAAQTKSRKLERDMVSVRRKSRDERYPDRAAQATKQLAEMEAQLKRYASEARNARSLDTAPVGTGPYMLESASTDNYVQLSATEWWFRAGAMGLPDMPDFDGVGFRYPRSIGSLARPEGRQARFIVLDAVQTGWCKLTAALP